MHWLKKKTGKDPYWLHISINSGCHKWLFLLLVKQAATPWFEARVGHLTGTTVLQALKVLKYVIADNIEERFRDLVNNLLCKVIGLSFAQKTEAHLKGNSQQSMKKAYMALGYKATKAIMDQDMIATIAKNAPSEMLEFQHIIVLWGTMTPIKKNTGKYCWIIPPGQDCQTNDP